jgi:hypothetical protein
MCHVSGRYGVTVATSRLEDATLTRGSGVTAFDLVRPLPVPGVLRRAALIVGDLLTGLAIVFCIPFVMLAIGIPIVLCVRLLFWIGALL